MSAVHSFTAIPQQVVSNHVTAKLHPGSANTLWITMAKASQGRCQNFSLPLLHGMRDLLQKVKQNGGTWQSEGEARAIQYAVLTSAHPDYFSLGGDLQHFRSCIRQRDKQALHNYSQLCLDMMYEWATGLNGRTTTIALVQGRALGGGFETALSADFLIAEEHSEFGFPEIMFGLFPCTGGMSLLARRVGVHKAERMMSNGRIYSATELHEMGVVDEICPRGEGNAAVQKFITTHAKRRVARLMLQRSRYRLAPLDYSELLTVVDEWVETAMVLPDADLRVMEVLAQMQLQQASRQAA